MKSYDELKANLETIQEQMLVVKKMNVRVRLKK